MLSCVFGERENQVASTILEERVSVATSMLKRILDILDRPHDLITFVTDRLGHDWRYAIDNTRIQSELGWKPKHDFTSGLQHTINWYLENKEWWHPLIT